MNFCVEFILNKKILSLYFLLILFIITPFHLSAVNKSTAMQINAKRGESFQRIVLALDKNTKIYLNENKDDGYIDLEIENIPGSFLSEIKEKIVKGSIVSGYKLLKKDKRYAVRIFVIPKDFISFYAIDKTNGTLILDIGAKKTKKRGKKEPEDQEALARFYIDTFLSSDNVLGSLLAHTHNFYFVKKPLFPLLRDMYDERIEYPVINGSDSDILYYNEAVKAYTNKDIVLTREALDKLYTSYERSPVFRLADFLKVDLYREELLQKDSTENWEWFELLDRLRKVVSIYPDSPLAPWGYVMMGEVGYKLKMYPEGARSFKKVADQYHYSDQANHAALKYAEYLYSRGETKDIPRLLFNPAKSSDKNERNTALTILSLVYKNSPRNGNILDALCTIPDISEIKMASDGLIFTTAEVLLTNEKTSCAREYYQTFMRNFPDSKYKDIVSFRLADTYMSEKNTTEAIKKYQETVNKYRNSEGSRLALLQITEVDSFLKNKDPEADIYEKAFFNAKTDFEYSILAFKLAMKYYRMGKRVQAITILASLIEKFPESVSGQIAKTVTMTLFKKAVQDLYVTENYPAIINFFHMIPDFLAKMEDSTETYAILGKALSKEGYFKESEKVFEKILKESPEDNDMFRSIALLNILDSYINTNKKRKAEMSLKYYEDYIKKIKTIYPIFLRLKGNYYKELEQNNKLARKYYIQSKKLEPYNINRLIIDLKLSEIAYEEGNYTLAEKESKNLYDYFQAYPKSFNFLERGAVIHLLSKVFQNKMDDYAKKLDEVSENISPNIRDDLNMLRITHLLEKKEDDNAEKILEKLSNKESTMAKQLQKTVKMRKDMKTKMKEAEDKYIKYMEKLSEEENRIDNRFY